MNQTTMSRRYPIWALLFVIGCSSENAQDHKVVARTGVSQPTTAAPGGAADEAYVADIANRERAGDKREAKQARPKKGRKDLAAKRPSATPAAEEEKEQDEDRGEGRSAGPRARAWFPETFLFEPLVITDDQGNAAVSVTVPDRLTDWRVLALAHSRAGFQAGAETRFRGTLPVYVDVVVPAFAMVGDSIRLPIQVVNTTAAPATGQLTVKAKGASLNAQYRVQLAAKASTVRYVTLTTDRPGIASVQARFGDADATIKRIPVLPTGKPITREFSGSLASPRKLRIIGPAGADPRASKAVLRVFPGALALVRSELAGSAARGGVAADAYALALAGTAADIIKDLGETPDDKRLRTLSIQLAQRVIRHGRNPDLKIAMLLTEAALAHKDNPILTRLGQRLSILLANQQRPDGSFGGGNGWTLQRLIVTTANATAVVHNAAHDKASRQRSILVGTRARGMFARNFAHIKDGYTAAAVLASGSVDGDAEAELRTLVLKDIAKKPTGAQYLKIQNGVVRADGQRPSRLEATALAAIALHGASDVEISGVGDTLLGGYSPLRGWGDGQTNLVCLRAVAKLFDKPVPSKVKVTLSMDGKVLAEDDLGARKITQVVTLESPVPNSTGPHDWEIKSSTAVAGLGYSLSVHNWVPWPKEVPPGLELLVEVPKKLTVGRPAALAVKAVAPSGRPIVLRIALPAGVQADTRSLDQLVSANTISKFETPDGAVIVHAPALKPAQTLNVRFTVIPTLAGTLHTGASSVSIGRSARHTAYVRPTAWVIRASN